MDQRTSKLTIKENDTYKSFHKEILQMLESGSSVRNVNKFLKQEVQKYSQDNYGRVPRDEAFNKVQGAWNELMAMGFLADISLKASELGEEPAAIFPLPNSVIRKDRSGKIPEPKFLELFREEEFESGGLRKLKSLRGSLFFSSPDFVIATPDYEEIGLDIKDILQRVKEDPSSKELYNSLKGKLEATDIKAAVSMKTSYRPDRIYQPCFEAAMIKAISHLTSQSWKYFMVSNESNESSDNLSSAHSVATGTKVRLVDRRFTFTNEDDLTDLFHAAFE